MVAVSSPYLILPQGAEAEVRVRHPRGVTTLDLDPANTTVDELKVLLFSSTEIPPSEQESESSVAQRSGALFRVILREPELTKESNTDTRPNLFPRWTGRSRPFQ